MSGLLKASGLIAMLVIGTPVRSEEPQPLPLPDPSGTPVLTVTGLLPVTNAQGTAVFDIAMLRELPQAEVRTTTPWTVGEATYRGTPLSALVERLGIRSGTLFAQAINDFSATIPLNDSRNDRAIIAYEINDEEIPVRGKGPLWLIYPFDSDDGLRSEAIYARSVWQLDRIEVRADETGPRP